LLADADRDRLAHRIGEWPAGLPHPVLVQGLAAGEVVALRVAPSQALWLCVRLPEPVTAERSAVEATLPIAVGAIRERLAERRLRLERNARARTSVLEELTAQPAEVS